MHNGQDHIGQEPPAADHPPHAPLEPPPPSPAALRLGLYVLPAMVVAMFLGSWLFVYWLLHEDQDPQSLVRGMQQPGRRSWQKAYALSQLLLDPAQDALKDDAQLCQALVAVLTVQNQQARQEFEEGHEADEELARFRAFLCRTLGEFRRGDGIPVLIACASAPPGTAANDPQERAVRAAAIEALAVLAANVGPQTWESYPQATEVLLAATHDGQDARSPTDATHIAAAAAFALGVVGSQEALGQLRALLDDTRIDVRYNAATGLARHGIPEAAPVLLEMLDPANQTATRQEITASARQRQQTMIQSNGIRAAERLLTSLPDEQQQPLLSALEQLTTSASSARIRIDARQVLLKMQHAAR